MRRDITWLNPLISRSLASLNEAVRQRVITRIKPVRHRSYPLKILRFFTREIAFSIAVRRHAPTLRAGRAASFFVRGPRFRMNLSLRFIVSLAVASAAFIAPRASAATTDFRDGTWTIAPAITSHYIFRGVELADT